MNTVQPIINELKLNVEKLSSEIKCFGDVDTIRQLVSELEQALQQAHVSGSLPKVDWKILRQRYLSECVVKDTVDGPKLRIDYAPHDLFEWFKKELTAGGNGI